MKYISLHFLFSFYIHWVEFFFLICSSSSFCCFFFSLSFLHHLVMLPTFITTSTYNSCTTYNEWCEQNACGKNKNKNSNSNTKNRILCQSVAFKNLHIFFLGFLVWFMHTHATKLKNSCICYGGGAYLNVCMCFYFCFHLFFIYVLSFSLFFHFFSLFYVHKFFHTKSNKIK